MLLDSSLLVGKKVRLTVFKEEDLSSLENWYNDIEFLRLYDVIAAFPKSSSQLSEMLQDIRKADDKYMFAVRTIDENKLVGVTGFENILWNNGSAVIYIGLGDVGARGKGIGREALALTIAFGFDELNLHRIQLNVLAYNEPAIKLYEGIGFKREGTYRECIHRAGRRYDMYLYGLLRKEWENRN